MSIERRRLVLKILEMVLDAPREDRDGILQRECGDDGDLRAEVEARLSLGTDPIFDGPLKPAEKKVRLPDGYTILEELGRGGMGTVFLADQDSPFKRKVAVKVINRGMNTDDIIKRFNNERQILAGMNHPNIARLYDGGETGDGLPFFVMEYIDGRGISSYCDRHNLTLSDRLKLFVKVCRGVQFAHDNQVVHRDLKPENILVTRIGEPKLLDFGIAKLMTDHTRITRTGYRAMTPEYASPEQIRGEEITKATDIYQLGILLYELLVGSRPFKAAPNSLRAIEKAVVEQAPTKPSSAVKLAVRELPRFAPYTQSNCKQYARALGGDLDNIVLMSLRKRPQDRYPSVNALIEDIENYLAMRPVKARRLPPLEKAKRFAIRHPWQLGLSMGFTVLLGVFLWIFVSRMRENEQAQQQVKAELDQAQKEKEAALQEREKSVKVQEMLISMIESADSGRKLTAVELIESGVKKVKAETQEEEEVRARLLTSLGKVALNMGDFDTARTYLEEVNQIYNNFPPDPLTRTTVLVYLAELALSDNDGVSAEAYGCQALTAAEPLGEDHLIVADGLLMMGRAYYQEMDMESSRFFIEQSLQMRRRMFGERHLEVADALEMLAMVDTHWRRFAVAETILNNVLTMRMELLEEDLSQEVADTLNKMAEVHGLQGDYLSAVPLLESNLEMCRMLLGDEDFKTVAAGQGLGWAYTRLRRYDEAVQILTTAAEAHDFLDVPQPYAKALLNQNLGEIHLAKGSYTKALAHLEPARAAFQDMDGRRSPAVARTQTLTAWSLFMAGQCKDAETLLRLTVPRRAGFMPGSRVLSLDYQMFALVLECNGSNQEAALWREQAMDLMTDAGAGSGLPVSLPTMAAKTKKSGNLEARTLIHDAISQHQHTILPDPWRRPCTSSSLGLCRGQVAGGG